MKENVKAVSDEEIIAAVLQSNTIQAAAALAGISPRAIYDRMHNRDFRALYLYTKADILRTAVYSVNNNLSAAVDTIAEIMTDKEVNAGTRLQAAQTIIKAATTIPASLTAAELEARAEGVGPLDLDF